VDEASKLRPVHPTREDVVVVHADGDMPVEEARKLSETEGGDWLIDLATGELTWRPENNRRNLTSLEFLRLFPAEKRKQFRRAAKQNEDVEDLLAMINAAGEIDPADADFQAGITKMQQGGLITAAEAEQIRAAVEAGVTAGP
jgi:hypothetical protein